MMRGNACAAAGDVLVLRRRRRRAGARCSTTTRRAGDRRACRRARPGRSRERRAHGERLGTPGSSSAPIARTGRGSGAADRRAEAGSGAAARPDRGAAHQIETLDKRQKDLYVDLDTRLRKLEQRQARRRRRPPRAGRGRRGKRLRSRAQPVQGRQLPGLGRRLPELPRQLSQQPARRQPRSTGSATPTMRPRDYKVAIAAQQKLRRFLARQSQGARRDAQHRQRAGRTGRPEGGARDAAVRCCRSIPAARPRKRPSSEFRSAEAGGMPAQRLCVGRENTRGPSAGSVRESAVSLTLICHAQ